MDEELVNLIKSKYDIRGQLNNIKTIPSYPHLSVLSFDEDYVIKKVNKIYCKDLNTLYNYLSKSSYIELPLKTINGDYEIAINNEHFIAYPYLQETKGKIISPYWAKALSSIHNIEVNKDDFDSEYTIDKECFMLLKQADELFDHKTKVVIKELLDNYYNDYITDKVVLSHGDPYDRNVMNNKTCIRLIDTDGMRLLPREFDIQRLFYNEVNHEKDMNEIEKYINLFFCNYPNKIDIDLFKKIYVTDLLRTFSWLHLVTKDKTRDDYSRQIKELEKYKESIISGRHVKVLKKI